jgi:ABC-2 type transport system permease protein
VSRLPAVRALAALGLRRVARDRLGLVFTVALPFTVILLVGLAFGGEDGPVAVAVAVDGVPGVEAARLVAALEGEAALAVERVGSPRRLRELVQRGAVVAGVLVPGQVGHDRPPVLVSGADAAGSAAARPVIGAVLARLADPGAHPPPVRTEWIGEDGALGGLPRFGYTAPANLVLFTFITSLTAAAGLIEARLLGVRRRLRAAPLGAAHLIAGETLGRLLIAAAQAVVVVTGAALLFGVRWGDPFGVAAVVGAFALVATAAAMLLGSILRTPQQASAVGPIAGIGLGMLGGCMWPLEIVPPAMRTLGHVTPHAWAVEALVALGGEGARLGDVLTEVAVLAAFAAALLPLAVWRLARTP